MPPLPAGLLSLSAFRRAFSSRFSRFFCSRMRFSMLGCGFAKVLSRLGTGEGKVGLEEVEKGGTLGAPRKQCEPFPRFDLFRWTQKLIQKASACLRVG